MESANAAILNAPIVSSHDVNGLGHPDELAVWDFDANGFGEALAKKLVGRSTGKFLAGNSRLEDHRRGAADREEPTLAIAVEP